MIAGIAVYIAVDRVRDVVTWFAPLLLVGACGLLIWLLVWMHRPGRGLKIAVAAAADTHIQNGSALGIFLLALTTTLREGVETAVFLATLVSPLLHWSPIVGAIIGMAAAMLIASFFMRGARAIPLRYVFSITTALLVLAIAHMAWEVVERA
jgi:high-affinity iron transporter